MKQEQGFIALVSILIVGALVLVVSIGVSLRAIGETQMSLGQEFGNRARVLADACAEYALMQLKNNLQYSGNETILLDETDSCDILPVEGSGNENRTVKTQATSTGFMRKIHIEIARVNPTTQITLWEEVADF